MPLSKSAGAVTVSTLSAYVPSNFRVIVNEASDLAGTLDSGKEYVIAGQIDMGSTSIEVPEGGLTIVGLGYDISALYSTDTNATLFTSPGGGYSGNLTLSFLSLYVTGTGAKVFDLDNSENFGAVEMVTVNLGTFGAPGTETTSLGEIANYRQLFMTGCAVIRPEDGLTLTGPWAGGMTLVDSILLVIPAGISVFKAGTGFDVQGNVRTNINALSIQNTTTVFDFAPSNFSNDEGFLLDGARFPLGSDPIPNMPITATERFTRNCRGIENSFPGGYWEVTAESTTTISASSTMYKLAGTTTYDNLQWCSGSASNALQYDSAVPLRFRVQGNLEVNGTKGKELELTVRVYDDSAAGYVDVQTFRRSVNDLSGRSSDTAFFNFECYTPEISASDRIELWISNETDTTNVTLLEGGTASFSALL